jgi:lipoprotein NlpI
MSSSHFPPNSLVTLRCRPAPIRSMFRPRVSIPPLAVQFPRGYALWLDIVKKRNNLPSRLPQAIAQLDMTKWPAPIIRLFLGQMTAEAVLAAADNPNPNTKQRQLCQANFYMGELALMQGEKESAIPLFRLALANCPKIFSQRLAANYELNARGVTP